MRAQSAVWTNPANGQVWVFITGNSGTHGFTVDVDSAGNPSLNNHWNIQNGWTTSAVVANGVLFTSADGGEHTSTATLHQVQAINPTTGAILWTGHIDLFHWESPIVVNGTVYMADGNSGGSAVAPIEGRQAARADRTALDATTRAGGRQRRVKQSCPEAAQMELTAYPPAQAMILASSTSPAIAWRTVGTAEGARSG